ncbi:hypothetical protein MSAN_01657600 [Mycena sanguinolenta]|uniref:Uncharacterized protein n=1 Tax=Mycena sanguinolenta TaxID=230812 RepID=A0A8H6Y203_9AGAR|nr:hypothetical protein MSAN_01657600 [Mycena sanguinolenta]
MAQIILPLELEREIFEIVALSRPVYIPTMMRVAQRVKTWVEPLLYRTLFFAELIESSFLPTQLPVPRIERIDGLPVCNEKIFADVVRRKSSSFLSDSVRNVMVRNIAPEFLTTLVETCSRIENLSATRPLKFSNLTRPEFAHLRPKELHCALHDLVDHRSNINLFSLPIFSQLTHLNLFYLLDESTDSSDSTVLDRWTAVGALQSLTHLSLPSHTTRGGLPILSHLLDVCKSLRALVVLRPPPSIPNAEIAFLAKNDIRFVMMRLRSTSDDWQIGALAGSDHWARVDEFIAKRAAGEISREIFYMEEFEGEGENLSPTVSSKSEVLVPVS